MAPPPTPEPTPPAPPGNERFSLPVEGICLSHCAVSPLHPGAATAARQWDEAHLRLGAGVFRHQPNPLAAVHRAGAALLGVAETDIAFLRNTAEGLSLLANGLPLSPGDRIVSYVHEYPSNHYPWRLQERRGAVVDLLPDRPCNSELPAGRPRGFTLEDVESRLRGGRVRVVAISHVQFTSGFTADLETLGRLCREHGAWLIVDAAQSLGVLPLQPAVWGVDAIAASGWKWLLGPIGSGLLYTSARLRAQLQDTMAGPALMQQGDDYLDHSWNPHTDARRFEYSTASFSQAAALAASINDLQLHHGPASLATAAARCREQLAAGLDPARFQPANFPGANGPILSWIVDRPESVVRRAFNQGITVTVRGGYLRTAPHFYHTGVEIQRAIDALNEAARTP